MMGREMDPDKRAGQNRRESKMSASVSDKAAGTSKASGQPTESQLTRELPEPVRYIENRTFDEIKIGDSASVSRTLTPDDIALFALVSGDINPAHLDPDYARDDMFHHIIVHGMWTAGLISAVLGTKLPGPGAIYLDQSLSFRAPVTPGDTITASVKVSELNAEKRRVTLDCHAVNQNGKEVVRGTALVIAPTEKLKRPAMPLPEVQLMWRTTLRLASSQSSDKF